MKICFLASADTIHSYRWIKYFAEKGHEIHWISIKRSNLNSIRNVHYYEISALPIKPFSILRSTMEVKRLIDKIKPELLHSHYVGTNGLIGTLSGFHPHIVTAWGSDILIAGKSIIKRPMIKYVLRKADLITCDANHMIHAMVKLGVGEKKIKLIYFGVEVDKYKPREKDENIKNKLGLSKSPAIISLRNLEPIYDVETLIKSMPYVLRNMPKAIFVIGGRGSQERYLKELAKSLGVSERIRFIGFIPNDDLPKYLTSVDVYVSTSLSDAGIAASTAEAMACGLPVVITDSGENSAWVKDGENGFLVPVKHPEILGEKIVALFKENKMRERYGEISRKIIEERNNYFVEMEKMDRIYQEIKRGNALP